MKVCGGMGWLPSPISAAAKTPMAIIHRRAPSVGLGSLTLGQPPTGRDGGKNYLAITRN